MDTLQEASESALFETDNLPTDIPTIEERVVWILGRATARAPIAVRPLIRSLLLPKLATLDSATLTENLEAVRTVLLPWVLGDGGYQSEPECWLNPEHVGHWTKDCPDRATGDHGQAKRPVLLLREDGLGEDDPS